MPAVGWHQPNRRARLGVQVEPDRVGDRPARPDIELLQVFDDVVARASGVEGAQRVVALPTSPTA